MNKNCERIILNLIIESVWRFCRIAFQDQSDTEYEKWISEHKFDNILYPKLVNGETESPTGQMFKHRLISNEANQIAKEDAESIRSQEIKDSVRFVGVINVFSKVNLNSKDNVQKLSYLPFYRIDNNINYPVFSIQPNKEKDLKELWKLFEQDCNSLGEHPSVEALLMLLEKSCSYIPYLSNDSNTATDISLFQHTKITAAIATSLFNCTMENSVYDSDQSTFEKFVSDRADQRYMMIGGDISGIQDFIYTVSSTGALRSLRGRSFYLEMLTEKIIQDLLNALDISIANVIYSGGGGFCLIAQNSGKSAKVVTEIKEKINAWLWGEFSGKLFYNIESVTFSGNDLISQEGNGSRSFSIIWQELSDEIEKSKRHRFVSNFDKVFKVSMPVSIDEACDICHTDSKAIDQNIPERNLQTCRTCYDLFKISSFLKGSEKTDNRRFIHEVSEGSKYHFRIANSFYLFSEEPHPLFLNYIINSWEASDWANIKGLQLLLGNYVTGCEELGELAEKSNGKALIGALRMDVDNLGEIFIKGLPRSSKTLTRMATISRSLTIFFKYYINFLCNGDGGLLIYQVDPNQQAVPRAVDLIYSGGDDLFLLGAWNHVSEMAFDIQNAFERYTGGNPDVTLSAGVTLHKPNFPVYQIAELSKKAEDHAKSHEYRENNQTRQKNSLCLFFNESWMLKNEYLRERMISLSSRFESIPPNIIQQACEWQKARQEIFDMAKVLNAMDWSQVPHAFFDKLFSVIEIWQRDGVFYMPMLSYVIKKSVQLLGKDSVRLLSSINMSQIAQLAIPLTWVEYLHRK